MEITEQVKEIKKNLKLISLLEKQFGIRPNSDVDDPLLYCGVAQSDLISQLSPEVEKFFGKAYKPAGEGAFFKNLFDKFIKSVGGVRKDQTLYKKDIEKGVVLYCAFWPWGTQPVKTSVRIGLLCYDPACETEYTKHLKGYFN